ncbi:hypothetical protein [Fredinandcohnia sp. 179-A 10B2 NHS]|uniref:hypothetical protein n=1 Tax=Fredinandcohnia sp. 179-A 10B2 NHS TaxID=3235176 RepID=UPI0039A016AC
MLLFIGIVFLFGLLLIIMYYFVSRDKQQAIAIREFMSFQSHERKEEEASIVDKINNFFDGEGQTEDDGGDHGSE